jgi:hypothetical protein
MHWFFRLLSLFLGIATLITGVKSSFALQEFRFDDARVRRATVFVMQVDSTGAIPVITCVSSGTLLTRSGLILTNAHSTVTSRNCPGTDLIISISSDLDVPPVPTFRARIEQSNAGLDIALLQIDRQIDGRLIDTNLLSLPFVELADSDGVRLDDTVIVVGFPDLGDAPVSLVRGTVIGFGAEPIGGDRAWLKTSITLPGAMSGAGAYDSQGRLIGIPTTAPIIGISPDARCLSLQDTNRDGVITGSDRCVPIGGSISVLRPSNFARPLFRAATLRLDLRSQTAPLGFAPASGTPTFSRLFFSPTVNDAGMPTSVVRALPAGTERVYLFFNYANMTPETVYELRVSSGGTLNTVFSLSPVRWSGGTSGLWYIGSSGQPWSNGTYDFTLLINGVIADSARLLIGSSAETLPTFGDIAFGIETAAGGVMGTGFVLPTGSIASARFIYRNMTPGLRWASIWYYQEVEVLRETLEWVDGASGTKTIRIQDPAGLLPGAYRLELYLDIGQGFRLAATSDFTLAGNPVGDFARIFENAHFTTASTPEAAVSAPEVSRFPSGTEAIYALFNWNRIRPGTLWTMRWLVDGEPFYDQTLPWTAAENGQNYLLSLIVPGGVPDGTYTMQLLINRIVFAQTEARVGIGQLPIDSLAQASGVQMRGQLFDAQTGAGIPNATVILISELYSVEQFTEQWSQEQVYATATTDRYGRFIIERLLQPRAPYSLYVTAPGYLVISVDGIEVNQDTPPLDIPFYLTRG